MSKSSDNRIYIGNLPPDVRTKDIEDLFYKYGKIKYIDLKNRRGPPFAFVEFDDPLDADDAIDGRDGYNFDGYKLRVEIQKGPRNPGVPRPSRSGPPTRRSDYRCIITNLPPTGSWQDLKDHMREAGNVCYADVFKDGTGVVEFIRYDDMKYAVKHLDDTKFRSHEGETSYIRVKADSSRRRSSSRLSRSRSKSRSRSRTRSRSRSQHRRNSERATPSYSPGNTVKRRTRSPSSGSDTDRKRSRKRSHSPRDRSSRSRSRSYRSRSRSSRSRSGSVVKSEKKRVSKSRSPSVEKPVKDENGRHESGVEDNNEDD